MGDYKVLTDNSALRRRLERKDDAHAADLVDVLVAEREPDLGERRMMADFGLTESELFAGLAGQSVDEWVMTAARENGVRDPAANPAVLRHLVLVKQLNADAHNVAFEDYDASATSVVRARMKVFWGSGMSGAEYLRRNSDSTLMDWSKEVRRVGGAPSGHAGKALSPNAPTDDIFSLSADSPDGGYAAYKDAKRRERMMLLDNLPEIGELVDDE